jgi:hypothetical protein
MASRLVLRIGDCGVRRLNGRPSLCHQSLWCAETSRTRWRRRQATLYCTRTIEVSQAVTLGRMLMPHTSPVPRALWRCGVEVEILYSTPLSGLLVQATDSRRPESSSTSYLRGMGGTQDHPAVFRPPKVLATANAPVLREKPFQALKDVRLRRSVGVPHDMAARPQW